MYVILMCNYKYLKTDMKLLETSLLIKNNPQIRDCSVHTYKSLTNMYFLQPKNVATPLIFLS